MKSNAVSPARVAAYEILKRVEEGAFASVLLASPEENLSPADRALAHELVLGVLRRRLWLDTVIEHFANRKFSSLDTAVQIILRLGLYQLRFLSRIPAAAAVNESVNLTRRARLRSAEGFVNAVMRRATREPEFDPLSIVEADQQLSIETSHPQWLLDRWIESFGYDFARDFALANNTAPPLAFRVVQSRNAEADVIRGLEEAGVELVRSEVCSSGWRASGATTAVYQAAQNGQIYVQDEASQLVAESLQPKPGERILDLCAAPGSKTTHLADLSRDGAQIVACDISDARLKTIAKSALLQGLKSITCLKVDGLEPLPFPDQTFDAVLVDAPCTGTGTLRRNPEIRWRITAADVHDLASRQKALLANAAQAVKAGGRLVYSTCSIEPEENEKIVSEFIGVHPQFERASLPDRAVSELRVWPNVEQADGFYLALLRVVNRHSRYRKH